MSNQFSTKSDKAVRVAAPFFWTTMLSVADPREASHLAISVARSAGNFLSRSWAAQACCCSG